MSPSSERQAASAGPAPESRREAKAAATRRKICESATACLAEAGYPGMTILQVVQRAGISQGALLHHYPSKEDLVAATADYLLNRSVKWFARAKEDLKRGGDAFAEVIRRSWREQILTADYAALLEIMTAARTDPALKARIRPALATWREAIEAELRTLFPAGADQHSVEAILTISRSLMTGLLIHDGLLDDRLRMERSLEDWLAIVKVWRKLIEG